MTAHLQLGPLVPEADGCGAGFFLGAVKGAGLFGQNRDLEESCCWLS